MPLQLHNFTAHFTEYEQSLDYYHGKDLVHQGCLLKLDPSYSWEKINSKIRNKIRKAQKLDVTIERVKGTAEDIKNFRTIWFDPKDPTIPDSLEEDEIMYLAYLDGQLTGGLILTPSSKKVLYMHNLGANDAGKRQNIPALVLWHAVEDLQNSAYAYIDVGVSFRPTLYTFFKNWQADKYPIIFNAPFHRPDIRLTSFAADDIPIYKDDALREYAQPANSFFGDSYTILPSAIHCFQAVLKHLHIQTNDTVAVFGTFDTNVDEGIARQVVAAHCQLSEEITVNTKAVIVTHTFGFPCQQTRELKRLCDEQNIPLIEDCTWCLGGALDEHANMGDIGDYAVFGLPETLPLPYGGILKGLVIDDEDNWNNYRMLDYFKRELILIKLHEHLPKLDEYNKQRRENWHYLAGLFAQDGFEALIELQPGVYPGVFLVRPEGLPDMPERYEEFGVESYSFEADELLALPVHGRLTPNQLDYIYGVFRGKLNLCSDYRRNKN